MIPARAAARGCEEDYRPEGPKASGRLKYK